VTKKKELESGSFFLRSSAQLYCLYLSKEEKGPRVGTGRRTLKVVNIHALQWNIYYIFAQKHLKIENCPPLSHFRLSLIRHKGKLL
jgi:hypothetical protein